MSRKSRFKSPKPSGVLGRFQFLSDGSKALAKESSLQGAQGDSLALSEATEHTFSRGGTRALPRASHGTASNLETDTIGKFASDGSESCPSLAAVVMELLLILTESLEPVT